jgi:spore maturation protein SpmB
MGLIVIIFMIGQGFTIEPFIGLVGAFVGSIISTRLMQYFILKKYPHYAEEDATTGPEEKQQDTLVKPVEHAQSKSLFVRILNSLLDGGRSGVDIGVAIIPGVLIISTFVMILTFGPSTDGTYTGAAYEGTQTLPWLASQLDFVFEALFGFTDSHQVVFPITALGAVGAALGLVPSFLQQGWLDGNAIAVCTAIGMCWSGFLSTHTAMLDSLGYRQLTSKAIISHTIGGLCAAIFAHWCYLLYMLL